MTSLRLRSKERQKKRRCEEIEADRKRKKRQDEQEQLLMQQKADSEVELEEFGNQEMGEEEEGMFAPSPVVAKEKEEEAAREVYALLEERLGEFALNCISLECCAMYLL